jgi:hypothetical protein
MMKQSSQYQPYPLLRRGGAVLVLLLVAGVLVLAVPAPGMAAELQQREPAPHIVVAVQAEPGILVAPGSVLAYHISVRNHGGKRDSYTDVRMPYNPQQITIIDSAFESSRDVVAELTSEQVVVRFGGMQAKEKRFATIFARVAATVPLGTVIPMRANYGETHVSSNWVPVIVGQVDQHSDYLWLTATPTSGPAGTVHMFCSDRYVPGEKVDPWLNRPDMGAWEIPGHPHPEVKDDGSVCIRFASGSLPPGHYQMVLQGMESKLTGVVDFVVTP